MNSIHTVLTLARATLWNLLVDDGKPDNPVTLDEQTRCRVSMSHDVIDEVLNGSTDDDSIDNIHPPYTPNQGTDR